MIMPTQAKKLYRIGHYIFFGIIDKLAFKRRRICGAQDKRRRICGAQDKMRRICGAQDKRRRICGAQDKSPLCFSRFSDYQISLLTPSGLPSH